VCHSIAHPLELVRAWLSPRPHELTRRPVATDVVELDVLSASSQGAEIQRTADGAFTLRTLLGLAPVAPARSQRPSPGAGDICLAERDGQAAFADSVCAGRSGVPSIRWPSNLPLRCIGRVQISPDARI
jgi:hypothetical protein